MQVLCMSLIKLLIDILVLVVKCTIVHFESSLEHSS